VRTVDGQRRAAVEVMLGTPTVRDLIHRNELGELKTIMEKSVAQGMQTFDQSLFDLFESHVVNEEEVMKHADSGTNLKLKIKLKVEGGSGTGDGSDGWGLLE
jgi:twitching motility protein PilU